MADARKYAQAQKFTLAVGISTTDTSITLQSFNFPDGTAIAAGDLGSINYGTLEPGTTREESISFTGITTNADGTVTLTGVTRGLGFGAVDTYSEQSNLKSQHGTGSIFILSNTAAFYNDFVNKYNDETMEGFLSVPTPLSNAHAATKQYVDETINGGPVSNDRIVQAGTAGESLAEGDLVYFDDTDNEWKKTDATSAATLNNVLLGIAQGSGSNGGAITGGVLTYGLDKKQTGLTPGVKLYAGDTPGAIVESAGTIEKVIGWSKSATEIYFDANVDTLPSASEKDAMAGGGDLGTPSSSNKFVTQTYASRGRDSLLAGETISGATLPVPVYQDPSDNEFYACDANVSTKYKFVGFAVSNGTNGSALTVVFNGIVGGFTGLTEGAAYYVQDTAGTIGTTPGSQYIQVGRAISETELLIQKAPLRATGAVDLGSVTASGSTAITTNFRPRVIRLKAFCADAGFITLMEAVWVNGQISGIGVNYDASSHGIASATPTIYPDGAAPVGSESLTFSITSVTDTGFTITYIENGSAASNETAILWEAESDI